MPVFSSVDQVLAPHGEYFSFSMNQFFTMDLLYISRCKVDCQVHFLTRGHI